MTPSEIIAAAREAGVFVSLPLFMQDTDTMVKLGQIIAAKQKEKDAQIAETPISGEQDDITMQAKDRIAAAIRGQE